MGTGGGAGAPGGGGAAARAIGAAAAFALAAGVAAAEAPHCPPGAAPPRLAPAPALRRPEPGRPLRVLAIGSSSTEGAGASGPGASYPARLQVLLGARLGPVEVVNAGRGGERAAGALRRLRALAAPGAWDLVIWQAGANDARDPGVAEAAFAATLADGIAAIRAAGAAPLLMDAQPWPADPDPARTARFSALVRDAAAAGGAAFFPRHALMAAWAPAARARLFAPDGLHHDDRGYACLAELLAGALAGGR